MSTVFVFYFVKWYQSMKCYLCHKNYTNYRAIYHCPVDDLFFSEDNKQKKIQYNDDYFESSPYNQRPIFNNIYFQEKLNKINGQRYSVITFFQVIEHLKNPLEYLKAAKKSLERLLKVAGFSNFKIKIDNFRFFSSGYIAQRVFKKLYIPQIINFSIPTDPWGDLEATVIKK